MNDQARRLASYGRYGDNNLVHVSNQELHGIEALTGKKFTRNPHTGLPEAFDFSSLIPIVAGIGGTILSGGNVGVGALAAGAASAGTSAAKGESAGTALTKGLVSGLTSYAGGSLLSGVGEAAAEGATQAAGQAATDATTQTGTQGIAEGVGANTPIATNPNAMGVPASQVGPFTNPAANAVEGAIPMQGIGTNPTAMGADAAQVGPSGPTMMDRAAQGWDKFSTKMENIGNDPFSAAGKFASNIGNDPMRGAMFAGGMYAQGSGMLNQPKPFQPGAVQPANLSPEFGQPRYRPATMPGSDYRAGAMPEFRYFAEGGEVGGLRSLGGEEYGTTANLVNEVKAVAAGEHPHPKAALARARQILGEDVVESIQNMYGGGRIRGSGGGLDDLVPGTIEGKQKVRLADSEFVVPADVVSSIGDGSTDQGVRKLNEMMSRVRKQKYGRDKQPPRFKDSDMPA